MSAPDVSPREGDARDARLGWMYTIVAVAPTFAYILAASIVPGFLSRPLGPGTPVTYGLLLGLALAVFLVVIASIYTYRLNRAERRRTGTP